MFRSLFFFLFFIICANGKTGKKIPQLDKSIVLMLAHRLVSPRDLRNKRYDIKVKYHVDYRVSQVAAFSHCNVGNVENCALECHCDSQYISHHILCKRWSRMWTITAGGRKFRSKIINICVTFCLIDHNNYS